MYPLEAYARASNMTDNPEVTRMIANALLEVQDEERNRCATIVMDAVHLGASWMPYGPDGDVFPLEEKIVELIRSPAKTLRTYRVSR